MRPPALTRLGVTAVAVLLTATLGACTSGSGSGSATSTAPTTASAGQPSASSTENASSPRPQAWVRGTKAVLTNSTGRTLDVGSMSGQGSKMPKTDETPLSTGDSRGAAQDWSVDASGTSVAFRVIYADDDVLELWVGNPAIGTPYIMWRKGYSVLDWGGDGVRAPDGNVEFDENTSQTLTMEGHQVIVTRGGDDDDNKNWTITLTS